MFASLAHDLRFAVRTLNRNRVFTVAVAATLALGIGALSAAFSAVYGVLVRPLPYHDPDRLVTLWVDLRASGRAEPEWLSFPDYADWREQSRSLSSVAAYTGWAATVPGDGNTEPERIRGASVSASYFDVLGVKPAMGRTFWESDDQPNAERVVVLSDGVWRRRFGADAGILGRSLTLNDEPWIVVGVMPPTFRAPMPGAEIWRPLRQTRFSDGCGRGCVSLQAIARLEPDVTLEAARADLTQILERAAQTDANVVPNSRAWPILLHDQLVGDVKRPLLILIGAVALVLLLACANLANLLLVRGLRRSGEIAVRLAMGAERSRIRRELLTESLLIAIIGGIGAVAVASAGTGILRAIMPPNVASVASIRLDWSVVAFTATVAILTGIAFGAAPAWRLGEFDLATVLRDSSRGGSRSDVRFRNALVALQFALAVVLLNAAGLLSRSFVNLSRTNLGFEPDRVAAIDLQLPRNRYASPVEAQQFFDALVERLRSLPGVESAAASSIAPFSTGDVNFGFTKEGEAERPGAPTTLWTRRVTPAYFATIGMPLRAGRAITADDRQGGPAVAVINESAARTYWPGESPVDKTILLQGPTGPEQTRIVGVVASARHDGPRQPVKPEIFVPSAQRPGRGMTIVVRASTDPSRLIGSIRGAVRAMEPALPVPAPTPMITLLDASVALPRLFMRLLLGFGAAALTLAAVGIYGMVRYSVETRTREFGVRLAVGAAPHAILALVAREVMVLAGSGIVLGIAGALAASRTLSAMLVGLSGTDLTMLVSTAVTLVAVGTIAMLVPARTAMRTDPSVALRQT
jgi:putative ABC transport system permease protein